MSNEADESSIAMRWRISTAGRANPKLQGPAESLMSIEREEGIQIAEFSRLMGGASATTPILHTLPVVKSMMSLYNNKRSWEKQSRLGLFFRRLTYWVHLFSIQNELIDHRVDCA